MANNAAYLLRSSGVVVQISGELDNGEGLIEDGPDPDGPDGEGTMGVGAVKLGTGIP